MKYHELEVVAHKDTKRVGRGIAAGGGKTAGRGTKGQKSRTGHSKLPAGFAGGQRELAQAVPKSRGDGKGVRKFTVNNRRKSEVVYLENLNGLSGTVDNFALAAARLISSPYLKVKILTRGEITAKIDLKTQAASKSAIEAIKKSGGSFTRVEIPARVKSAQETVDTK